MKAILARRSTQWIIFNLLGMAGYLTLASRLWVPAAEFGQPGGPGDAFYIALVLWPYLLAFAVLNFIVLVVIVSRVKRDRRSYDAAIWLTVSIMWIAVLFLDRYLAFNIVELRYV